MKRRDPGDVGSGAAVEGPIGGLAALRDVEPPRSLVAAVMQKVSEPRPTNLWTWLWRPRRLELRLSPVGMGAMLAGTAVVAVLAVRPAPRSLPTIVVQQPAESPGAPPLGAAPAPNPGAGAVLVRFVLQAKGARRVALAGEFNEWNPDATVLEPADGDGNFVAAVTLLPGTHEYMFVVDGRWVTDPAAVERRPDGFGRENALLRI